MIFLTIGTSWFAQFAEHAADIRGLHARVGSVDQWIGNVLVAGIVERGARLDIRNKQGRTALESVLRGKEHSAEIAAFLRERSPAPASAP